MVAYPTCVFPLVFLNILDKHASFFHFSHVPLRKFIPHSGPSSNFDCSAYIASIEESYAITQLVLMKPRQSKSRIYTLCLYAILLLSHMSQHMYHIIGEETRQILEVITYPYSFQHSKNYFKSIFWGKCAQHLVDNNDSIFYYDSSHRYTYYGLLPFSNSFSEPALGKMIK